MKRIASRPLFLANVAILLISLCAGGWLYSGALGWVDALNMCCPYQLIGGGNESLTAWDYVRDWYTGVSGKVFFAFLGSLSCTYSRHFAPTPESFPWWMLRSLSLFCIIAVPVNFIYASRLFGREQVAIGALALASLWALWTINNNTYSYSVWFDMLFADKCLPMYLLSLMACGVSSGWFDRNWMRWSIFAIIYVLISYEHLLPSVPLILLAYSIQAAPTTGFMRSLAKRLATYTLLSLCAALMYFMSPGQQLRMTMLPHRPLRDLTLTRLWWWYKDSVPLGYDVLLAPHENTLVAGIGFDEVWSAKAYVLFWVLHTVVLFTVLGMTIISYYMYRKAERLALPHKDKIWELFAAGLLASSFMIAYPASLTTLILTSYFPQYAIHVPALLLAIGLFCCVAFVIRFFGSETFCVIHHNGAGLVDPRNEVMKNRRSRRAAIIVFAVMLTLIFVLVTIPNIGKIQASYREVMKQNALRRSIYEDLLDRNQRTGDTHFILGGFPLNSLGVSLDAPWGLAAYFRWHHRPEITVYIDNNYDYPTRPLDKRYVTVNYAEFLRP
ncbi:MAG: hypothetical protein ACLQPD_05785 [Desulfomonilaceae bacterium]